MAHFIPVPMDIDDSLHVAIQFLGALLQKVVEVHGLEFVAVVMELQQLEEEVAKVVSFVS
jgi:hypothetical protein